MALPIPLSEAFLMTTVEVSEVTTLDNVGMTTGR